MSQFFASGGQRIGVSANAYSEALDTNTSWLTDLLCIIFNSLLSVQIDFGPRNLAVF